MKMYAKEILRWSAVVLCGGYGLWQLLDARRGAVAAWNGNWLDALFLLVFPLAVAAPLLAVAYICLRRQYPKLFLVLGVIGCVVLFSELSALPEQLGLFQFLDRRIMDGNHDLAFLGLPIALLILFCPIYVAAWFFRICYRLAYPGTGKRPKTRATRWLVWLGVSCCLAPTFVGMLVSFNALTQTPPVPVSPATLHNVIRWSMALTAIGVLMVFLGVARRQPIPKLEEKTFPPNTA